MHPRPRLPIGKDAHGLHVRLIQRVAVLLECKYPAGGIPAIVLSGRYLSNTIEWVAELQKEFGQPETGMVDQKFIRALQLEVGIDFWKLLEFVRRRKDKKEDGTYNLVVMPPAADGYVQ